MVILAKAIRGQEYLYSAKSAHEVSKAKAEKIKEVLNGLRWNLKDNEVWHVFEVDGYDSSFDYATYQSFRVYKGTLKEVRG